MACYNANLRGIGSRDTHVLEYLSFSLATRWAADVDAFPELRETGVEKGYVREVDGHSRVAYPIVVALAAAPAYWLAAGTGLINGARPSSRGIEAVGKLVASGFTAAAITLLVLLVSAQLPRAPALFVAVVAGLATPLWSSASQALWSHGPAACFLALGLLLVSLTSAGERGEDQAASGEEKVGPRPSPVPADVRLAPGNPGTAVRRDAGISPASQHAMVVLAAGVALGLAAACRPLLVLFPICGATGLALHRRVRNALLLSAGAGAVIASLGVYNLVVFGNVLGGLIQLESPAVHAQAHAVGSAFSDSMAGGLAGILFSPNRGLLVFTPLVLLAVPGAVRLWRLDRLTRWTVIVPTCLFLLGWAKYSVWWGGHSYGPRYASDIVVPLAVAAAAANGIPWVVRSRLAKAAIVGALAWSVGVQAVGAFCYPGGNWNGSPVDVDRAHERLWDWHDTEIGRTLKAGMYRGRVTGSLNRVDTGS